MRFGIPEMLVNIAHFQKFCIGVNCRRRRNSCRYLTLAQLEVANATLFDIKDGHRFVDPSGSDLMDDDAAIAKAKVLAIGVSIDTPAVDPKRHVAALNGLRKEIFLVSVYSKPSTSST